MRIEDVIAANSAETRAAVQLHQGVVTNDTGPLPVVRVAGQELEMVSVNPVFAGEVVQVLSAGYRWLILGTVSPGSGPNLLPMTGWQSDIIGANCLPLPDPLPAGKIPEPPASPAVTQFSYSGDHAYAVGNDVPHGIYLYSDQGDALGRWAGSNDNLPLAPITYQLLASGHRSILLGQGFFEPYRTNSPTMTLAPGGKYYLFAAVSLPPPGTLGTASNECYVSMTVGDVDPTGCGLIEFTRGKDDVDFMINGRWVEPFVTGAVNRQTKWILPPSTLPQSTSIRIFESELDNSTGTTRVRVNNVDVTSQATLEYVNSNSPYGPRVTPFGPLRYNATCDHFYTSKGMLPAGIAEFIFDTSSLSEPARQAVYDGLAAKYLP